MATESGLIRTVGDGVLTLALDRPRASNAVDAPLSIALATALRAAQANDEVHAVVLTATREKVFSAGIDVKNPDALDHIALSTRRRETVTRCLEAIVDFDKPLVAAVNGHAIGLGAMLALLCDSVVAAEHATLSLPEVNIGIPTFLGMVIVTRLAGSAIARDLVLSARRMSAAEAQQRGLINVVTSAASLASEADTTARMLAAKPKVAYALDKQWLARDLREALDEANARSAAVQPLLASESGHHKGA
ncbi:MAG: enoyl-CoA hydratase/isomerase family protein [Rhodospirillaceae bacterium]